MDIFCNGSPVALPVGASLQSLIEILGVEPKGTAIAVDDVLIVKTQWASCALREGCRVTIIRAAQGG